jgi:nucleoside-diphosphate-sugar epimerase
MKRAERLIRNTPVPAEFAEYGKRTWYTTEKAQRVLGYRPRFPLSAALPLTAAWLHHHGFVEDARAG